MSINKSQNPTGKRGNRLKKQNATLDLAYKDKNGADQKGTVKISISTNRSIRVKRGRAAKERIFDESNGQVTCIAACPYNPDRKIEVTVPSGMFQAPTLPEADDEAREFGNSMANSMLDCSFEVVFKIANATGGGYADGTQVSVTVTAASNGTVIGPQYGSPDSDNGEIHFWLEDGAPYYYSVTFYHPTEPYAPMSGSFAASPAVQGDTNLTIQISP